MMCIMLIFKHIPSHERNYACCTFLYRPDSLLMKYTPRPKCVREKKTTPSRSKKTDFFLSLFTTRVIEGLVCVPRKKNHEPGLAEVTKDFMAPCKLEGAKKLMKCPKITWNEMREYACQHHPIQQRRGNLSRVLSALLSASWITRTLAGRFSNMRRDFFLFFANLEKRQFIGTSQEGPKHAAAEKGRGQDG
jgi:hypothetical protein